MTDYAALTVSAAKDNVSKIDDMIAEAETYLAKLRAARDAWAAVAEPSAWEAAVADTSAAKTAAPSHAWAFDVILSAPF